MPSSEIPSSATASKVPVRFPLSAEEMLKLAQNETGIHIDDAEVREPFGILVKSLNEEGDMFERGAIELQTRLMQMLKNRLRMLRDLKAHPEILDQEIKAPIMISGTLRTGSTKLQNVLSASGDFNWLSFWKVYNFASRTGKPDEDVAPRLAEVDAYFQYNDEYSPEIKMMHDWSTYAPEEETLIALQTMRTPSWFGYGNIPSYMAWISQQDLTPTFEYVRDALKYLQWQGLADPDKRWMLKSPFNFGMEDMIKAAFPDAMFVYTHRPPSEAMPSLFSLLEALIKVHANNPTVDPAMTMMGQTMTFERHMQLRRSRPDIDRLDIHFRDAVGDLETVVRRVYDFAGVALTDQALQNMIDWETKNPMHKHGVHKYSLSDYGLTAEAIEQNCPTYMKFLAEAFAAAAK